MSTRDPDGWWVKVCTREPFAPIENGETEETALELLQIKLTHFSGILHLDHDVFHTNAFKFCDPITWPQLYLRRR